MSFLFLPGTVIHEMAHAFMAILMGVNVGHMEFIPKLIGQSLKLGSVEIAHTDPVRRLFIGIGPFLFGTILILGAFFYATKMSLFDNQLFVIVISYCIFEIGNTMFSSKKDMEGAFEVIVALIFITLVVYFAGFRIPAMNPSIIFANPLLLQTFQKADIYLAAPIGIDILLIVIIKIFKH